MDIACKLESRMSIFEVLSTMTQNQNLIMLVKYICKAIISIAPNVASSIPGIRVSVKMVKEQEGGILISKNPNWKLYRIVYSTAN